MEVKRWKTDSFGRDIVVYSNGRVFREILPYDDKDGYPTVTVCNCNKPVHRIVAETYIPNTNETLVVGHKDDDKHNNSYTNLEWITTQKNNFDACIRGMRVKNCLRVKCIELNKIYFSCGEASRQLIGNTSLSEAIRLCARGQRKQAYGYHWEVVSQ